MKAGDWKAMEPICFPFQYSAVSYRPTRSPRTQVWVGFAVISWEKDDERRLDSAETFSNLPGATEESSGSSFPKWEDFPIVSIYSSFRLNIWRCFNKTKNVAASNSGYSGYTTRESIFTMIVVWRAKKNSHGARILKPHFDFWMKE